MSDVKPDAEPFWFLAKYVGPDSEGSDWFSTGKSDWSRVKQHTVLPLYAKPVSAVNAEAAEQFEALDVENHRLRRALSAAATSLATISASAGRDEYMQDMLQLRGYANSRAQAAQSALSQDRGDACAAS